MHIFRDQVIEVLKTIIHPSTGVDIVTMNIVSNVQVENGKLSLELTFSNANDPLRSSIKRACETILKEKFADRLDIDVHLNIPSKPVATDREQEILPFVKNTIAIASGKGGVGKSTVATNLALAFATSGAKVGLIDADIFGPSVPRMLGLENEKPSVIRKSGKDLIVPPERFGIKILSIGLFIDPDDATVWRGPMASNALRQLFSDADWGELDYLFVDLPPGTSDIHLTLVQTIPVTGVVIVSTPQPVALADAIKGINMFRNETIKVPVLGLIENMSWFTPEELPENRYYIFGKDGCVELASKMNIPLLGQIPLVQSIRESSDNGEPVVLKKQQVSENFKSIAEKLQIEILKRNTYFQPTQKVRITRH
jgi:ATP-binding protein involved in chromosome partitioning